MNRYPLLSGMDLSIVDSPVLYLSYLWRKIKRFFLQKRKAQIINISLGDIMHCREKISHLQWSIAALYLDVERYYTKGDESFFFQNVSKYMWYGQNYDHSVDDQRFKDTLDSIAKKGYKKESFLEVDCEISLQNGTHRVAILLYLHQYEVGALCFAYKWHYFKDSEAYINKMGFDENYIKIVNESYNSIEDNMVKNGIAFTVLCDGDLEKVVECFNDSNIRVFNTRKTRSGLLFQFSFKNPNYYVSGTKIISRAAERLEKKIKKFGGKIVTVSKNCTEGQEIWKRVIEKENLDYITSVARDI